MRKTTKLINKIKELSKWKDILHSWMKVKVLVAPSCFTLYESMDCSLPGFSVHGVLQAWILEWVAMPSSRGSSQLRDQTQVSHISGIFFTVWATRKSHEYWISFSRGSFRPRNQIGVSFIACGFFTSWATREAIGYYLVLKKEMSYQSMKRHGGNFNTCY